MLRFSEWVSKFTSHLFTIDHIFNKVKCHSSAFAQSEGFPAVAAKKIQNALSGDVFSLLERARLFSFLFACFCSEHHFLCSKALCSFMRTLVFLERTYAMTVISHMYFLLVSMPHCTTSRGEKENENVFSFSSNRTLESYAYVIKYLFHFCYESSAPLSWGNQNPISYG